MNLSDRADGDTRVDHQAGYLLHQRPFKERSTIVEIFTHDWGRIGLVANGVRKERSRLAGLLQPFQRLLFSWRGRGELKTLTSVEAAGPAELLQGDSLISGLYLNELMLRLTSRHDPHPMLFSHYYQALDRVARDEELEWCLREFERDLLQELGYGLNLSHDSVSGEEIEPDAIYCYYPHGPEKLDRQRQAGGELTLKGETLLAISSGRRPGREGLREAKQLMRAMLQPHLGDKPLMSRSLFQSGR
ncbi:MAG: DNA repair protein RecO [Gammaproteobacteria bacterium]|nr:DNA repair protein RecO [Gammaproteobacteria bacterium]